MARELTGYELDHIDVLVNDLHKKVAEAMSRYDRPMEEDEAIHAKVEIMVVRTAPEA